MDWRPIDTAPKDGTICRVKRVQRGAIVRDGRAYFGDMTIDYGAHGIVAGLADTSHTYDGVWIDEDGRHLFPQPTHWLPAEDQ